MQSLTNIEKSGFRRGEYVGYSHGVWIIKPGISGGWYARHREFSFPGFHARTLREVSDRLAELAFVAHQAGAL